MRAMMSCTVAARGVASKTLAEVMATRVQAEIDRAKSGGSGLGEHACRVLAVLGDSRTPTLIQQVIDQDDALSGEDGVFLNLKGVGAVFQIIAMRHGGAGELAFLAQHDEAAAERIGKRRRHQKPARFDAGQKIGFVCLGDRGEAADSRMPGRWMGEQRRDVVKQDTGLGEIRNLPDMIFEVDVVRHGET